MISLDSVNGPSITLALPRDTRMSFPSDDGCNPAVSTSEPFLNDSSTNFPMASMSPCGMLSLRYRSSCLISIKYFTVSSHSVVGRSCFTQASIGTKENRHAKFRGPFMRRLQHTGFLALAVAIAALQSAHAQQNAAPLGAVVVTGAPSGIGRKITERLASSGYWVYAGARTQQEMDALDAIKNVEAVRLDV